MKLLVDLSVVGSIVLGLVGCERDVSCEQLAAKNLECSSAFVDRAESSVRTEIEAELAALSPSSRELALVRIDEQVAKAKIAIEKDLSGEEFIGRCMRDRKDRPPSRTEISELARCYNMSNCDEYASCFSACGASTQKK